jgi:hypothetical protein
MKIWPIATAAVAATLLGRGAVGAELASDRKGAAKRGPAARADAPIALLTNDNVERAIAAFPKPFQPYPDPFSRLLRGRG